jgi:hypothetical protein
MTTIDPVMGAAIANGTNDTAAWIVIGALVAITAVVRACTAGAARAAASVALVAIISAPMWAWAIGIQLPALKDLVR